VDIAHVIEPAYQLRRYAWSPKLPLSILTDRQIDRLVYDLYGLTAEEVAVVEGGAGA